MRLNGLPELRSGLQAFSLRVGFPPDPHSAWVLERRHAGCQEDPRSRPLERTLRQRGPPGSWERAGGPEKKEQNAPCLVVWTNGDVACGSFWHRMSLALGAKQIPHNPSL